MVVVNTYQVGFGLNGTERTPIIIVDIFDIVQKVVRDIGIHLKVDEKEPKSSKGPQQKQKSDHIQRIGYQRKNYGGQSCCSWSAKQGKYIKRESLAAHPPHAAPCSFGENKIKIT